MNPFCKTSSLQTHKLLSPQFCNREPFTFYYLISKAQCKYIINFHFFAHVHFPVIGLLTSLPSTSVPKLHLGTLTGFFHFAGSSMPLNIIKSNFNGHGSHHLRSSCRANLYTSRDLLVASWSSHY